MLVKNPNYDRPLYYIGYIGSTKFEQILIDPGLALSIMSVHLMQILHIVSRKLSTTTIHDFNVQSN